MPVRTRRQAAAAAKSNTNKEPINKSDGIINVDDCWDTPEKDFKSSVIKTYSKKQPFRTCWTAGSKKSKCSVKSQRTVLSQATLSGVINSTPATSKKLLSSSMETAIQMSGCAASKSTVKGLRNKTRVAVESMMACTVLPAKPTFSDTNQTAEDMSLCSMAHANIQDNMMIRNSTVLADCCNMNQEFVPNEISTIEGENELQDTIVSNYDEQTPLEKQPIQTVAQSVKKVRFGVVQAKKAPKKNQNNLHPSAKRSILIKTPVAGRRNISPRDKVDDGDAAARKYPKRQKTSSPDPNKQISMLHCEISTLLIEDYSNKKQSKRKSSVGQMTQDTEKLLDFEPLPLERSEVVGENSRDVTPEACNSTKGPSSSVKRRRRLSYHCDENIPACILLDHPVTKITRKATVWFRKNPHRLFPEEIETIEGDILL